MRPLVALSRLDVGNYVDTLVLVYVVLIFINILLSWIPRIPYNRVLAAGIGFVKDVTDPYLNLFRRFLPPVKLGGAGALDLSPIVGTFALLLLGGLLADLIRG